MTTMLGEIQNGVLAILLLPALSLGITLHPVKIESTVPNEKSRQKS